MNAADQATGAVIARIATETGLTQYRILLCTCRTLVVRFDSGAPIPVSDGPVPPNEFRWRGQSRRIPPQTWRLLALLWLGSATVAEVFREMGGRPSETRLRQAIHRANGVLRKCRCPLLVDREGNEVRLRT